MMSTWNFLNCSGNVGKGSEESKEINAKNFDEVIRKLTKHFLLEKEPVL